ncbi:MAG: hypothetical protein RLZZ393_1144 [Pseudomonadota bacterium]|jgi:hypothetical protein
MRGARRRPTLAALALLAVLPATAVAGSPDGAARAPRAVWTWEEDTERLVQDEAAAERALQLARREGIQTFYLYADSFQGRNLLQDDAAGWRRLLRRFHSSGITVHALLGSAYLHTERYVLPEHRAAAVAMVGRVLEFNAGGPSAARFDAIHFDIEPHQLDEWDTRREALLAGFLDMGSAFMALKRQAGSDIPIGPDIPFWLDGITLEWRGHRATVAEHAIGLFDFVTLMDYRNRADGGDGIVSHARTEMEIAERLGKRVVIGLETGEGELPKVTFKGLPRTRMEEELAATETAFRASPAFAGFAIHHYSTWQAWLSATPEPATR